MPTYTTASTATALGVSKKWLDNLLSHNKIACIDQARQGVPRKLSSQAISIIAATKVLIESGKIPAAHAVTLAEQLVTSEDGSMALSGIVTIILDKEELQRTILDGLASAVEVTPHPARGRPPLSFQP